MSRSLPKTLLLTASVPGSSGVGPLFLRELCASFPHDRLCIGGLAPFFHDSDVERFKEYPKAYLRVTESLCHRRGLSWLSVAARHAEFLKQRLTLDGTLTSQLAEFAVRNSVEQIWAVLNSPLTYRLSTALAQCTGLPLVATVWDPPEGVGLHYGLDRLSRKRATRDFLNAMRTAVRTSVISERMASEYANADDSNTVVLRHGISRASQLIAASDNGESELRIGFCGSLYAESEWRAFLGGLEELKWQVDGKPVRLIVAGGHVPFLSARCPANVEFLGWRDMEEVVDRLSQCQFCYLPYWFNPAYRDSVRLCFPTKMTTYLTAGRPVFYHGPEDAAVVDFFGKYNIAQCCHSLERTDVARCIVEFVRSADLRLRMHAEVKRAVDEELNLDVFHARFHKLMFGKDPRTADSLSSNREVVAAEV